MIACTSLIGALLVTIGWMFGLSYVDYLVARRRHLETGAQRAARAPLATERFLALPWEWSVALISGGVVLLLTWVSVLLGPWVFVLVNLIGGLLLGALLLLDLQQLLQG